jgi:hypothetical protein
VPPGGLLREAARERKLLVVAHWWYGQKWMSRDSLTRDTTREPSMKKLADAVEQHYLISFTSF